LRPSHSTEAPQNSNTAFKVEDMMICTKMILLMTRILTSEQDLRTMTLWLENRRSIDSQYKWKTLTLTEESDLINTKTKRARRNCNYFECCTTTTKCSCFPRGHCALYRPTIPETNYLNESPNLMCYLTEEYVEFV